MVNNSFNYSCILIILLVVTNDLLGERHIDDVIN